MPSFHGRDGFARKYVLPVDSELAGGLFLGGRAEAVKPRGDMHLLKADRQQIINEFCLRQSAGDSPGSQINVTAGILREFDIQGNICQAKAAAGPQHPHDFAKPAFLLVAGILAEEFHRVGGSTMEGEFPMGFVSDASIDARDLRPQNGSIQINRTGDSHAAAPQILSPKLYVVRGRPDFFRQRNSSTFLLFPAVDSEGNDPHSDQETSEQADVHGQSGKFCIGGHNTAHS